MSLHVYGESFKDEIVVRGSRHLGESERHPLYRRQKNHHPLRISNQGAFNRFMQQCYEEAERKARLEDAREREVAAREGRPYRSREERERIKKEKEEKEKREQEERKRRGESGAGFQPLKTFDATRAYYQTLGVDENASSKEIKKAYKKLALKYHPDKMQGKTEDEVKEAEQIFKEAMEAYEILVDEDTRERYDKARDARKFGKNSPMNNPEFAEKFAKMREEARRERLRKQNMKADRLEIIVTVSMQELFSGCFKEIKYDRKSKTGEIETVTKNIEVRKGWSPGRSNPIILDSEGHRSREYQDGDVYCIIEEAEHKHFRRSNAKDLVLKQDFCPTFEEGDILCLLSIETLEGRIVQRVVSYLTLLLSSGGEDTLTEPLIGMPDPNAPWFDPPGNVLINVSVPLSRFYSFNFVGNCVCLRSIYMIGNESDSIQAAATAFQVYHDTLIGNARKKAGICISLSNNISPGAETFITVVKNLVKTLDWVIISIGSKQLMTPLLDEEVLAIEAADLLIVDSGSEGSQSDIRHLIAPIDAEEDSMLLRAQNGKERISEFVAMSYGSGACGQLAQGESARSHTFRGMSTDYHSKDQMCPIDVSAGESHSAVLLSNGEVLTSGMGNYGQTGRPDNRNTFALEPIVWDYFLSPPKVVSISCGSRHTLLLDETGSVWSLGCGKYGQLGHGETYDVNEPVCVWPLLEESGDCKAVQVSAGDVHSLMCDSLGRSWSWGNNSKGQLGTPDLKDRLAPSTIELGAAGKQKENSVSSVSAGKVNSAFLTAQGRVFTCGSCKSQLLGYASSTDVIKPTPINSLSSIITKVELQEHVAVVLDSTGAIFTWGEVRTSRIPTQTSMYQVMHSKVAVRADPSTSSRIAGIKYRGDIVSAIREKDGWIELAPESITKGGSAKKESLWMLIDGSQLNLGLLLKKISDNSSFESQKPKRVEFQKLAVGVACFGREIVACCDDGSVWSISFDTTLSGKDSVFTKELSSCTGAPLNSCGLSASNSHVMILSDPSAKQEEHDEISDFCLIDKREKQVEKTDQDLEKELKKMSTLLKRHNLYEKLWELFLKGTIIVGLGEASSLLGIGEDNCGVRGPPVLALIPNVIRRCVSPTTSLKRLHDAVQKMSSRFCSSNEAPYNDVMGSSFLQHACYAWNPKNQSINCFVKAPEKITEAVEASADEYLSLLCLRKDEIGAEKLCGNWSHRMTYAAITAAAVGSRDRLRLKQKREESLRHIKQEECKVMGEAAHVGQRSNFDVFGCERGQCNACKDCKGYAQPLHMGIASGSYAFLCASCGCPHSDHAEVIH